MSFKLISIQEVAEFLVVSPQTLLLWELEGKLLFDERTAGGGSVATTLRDFDQINSMRRRR